MILTKTARGISCGRCVVLKYCCEDKAYYEMIVPISLSVRSIAIHFRIKVASRTEISPSPSVSAAANSYSGTGKRAIYF